MSAALLGCFILLSFTMDLLGLGYYSTDPPPLRTRLLRWVPAMAGGLALVVPYRWLRSRKPLWLLTAAFLMLGLLWTVAREIATFRQYAAGQMTGQGLVISLFVGAIVMANVIIFFNTSGTHSASGATPSLGRGNEPSSCRSMPTPVWFRKP